MFKFLFLAIACWIKLLLACDPTIFIKHNGLICNEQNCTKSTMASLTLSSGKLTCFKDRSENLITIEIKEVGEYFRYKQLYKTSDFSLKVSSLANFF